MAVGHRSTDQPVESEAVAAGPYFEVVVEYPSFAVVSLLVEVAAAEHPGTCHTVAVVQLASYAVVADLAASSFPVVGLVVVVE